MRNKRVVRDFERKIIYEEKSEKQVHGCSADRVSWNEEEKVFKIFDLDVEETAVWTELSV